MSATYQVQGYVDVRIKIDNNYYVSNSSTPEDIANSVLIGLNMNVELLNHVLKLERIS
jgi:hypothetical protein